MKNLSKIAGILVILGVGVLVTVEASAQSTCAIEVRRDVNFGDYDPLAFGNLDTTGEIRVKCKKHQQIPSYTLKIGQGSGGSFTPRRMLKGAEPLNYNLYMDSTRTVIWGNGTSGTSFYTVAPVDANTDYIVYGRAPLGQNVSAGAYSDSVTVTVEW